MITLFKRIRLHKQYTFINKHKRFNSNNANKRKTFVSTTKDPTRHVLENFYKIKPKITTITKDIIYKNPINSLIKSSDSKVITNIDHMKNKIIQISIDKKKNIWNKFVPMNEVVHNNYIKPFYKRMKYKLIKIIIIFLLVTVIMMALTILYISLINRLI